MAAILKLPACKKTLLKIIPRFIKIVINFIWFPFGMKKNTLTSLLFLLSVTWLSCNPAWQSATTSYYSYRINTDRQSDAGLSALLQPYSDSVNKSMNDVLGFNENTLEKKQPEGSLGNFMADAVLYTAEKKFDTHIDAALINFGGVRLNQLPAGNITRGKLYELMPFDNLVVLQKIKGTVLQEFLDHVAGRGGWPVAGISMQIKNAKAVNIFVNAKKIDPDTEYIIANSDYIANGGDDVLMLKLIPQQNIGYLMRDALIEYVSDLTAKGKHITVTSSNRVSNAE
jgi:2',3'-cyclic-nucleotide 2'-phosphodiesterase (5'-nucleotidase family)